MISIRSFVLTTMVVAAAAAASFGQFRVSITIAPPALPVYEQPLCPGDGYIWTPGYWYWDDDADDYYWVPGTWVMAPEPGFLWTPGWWGWGGSAFLFHEGYWGPQVGFYGGVVYGFGYFGAGYDGGRWEGGHFFYNRTVNNVNATEIHNVYNTTVVHEATNRVSYNGGNGGIDSRPTPEQESAVRERHVPPVTAQTQHVQAARSNPRLRASANQGRPPIAATSRPGDFNERSAVPAKEAGAPYHAPANRPEGGNQNARAEGNSGRPANPTHVTDLPPMQRPAPPNTGNTKTDAKYQKQQQKLSDQQDNERLKLQQKQEQDHQRVAKQQASEARNQQMEQKHQQQTQQLQQRHATQQQSLQQRQQPVRQNEARPPKGK